MKLAIAGTGYVGLSGAMLLFQNHKAIDLDIPEKIEQLNNKISPIVDADIIDFLPSNQSQIQIRKILFYVENKV